MAKAEDEKPKAGLTTENFAKAGTVEPKQGVVTAEDLKSEQPKFRRIKVKGLRGSFGGQHFDDHGISKHPESDEHFKLLKKDFPEAEIEELGEMSDDDVAAVHKKSALTKEIEECEAKLADLKKRAAAGE